MTLENQHKQYLEQNPDSTFTFFEWKEQVLVPRILDAINQIHEIEEEKNLTIKNNQQDEAPPPVQICKTCAGKGAVRRMVDTVLGKMQTTGICPICNGKGINN